MENSNRATASMSFAPGPSLGRPDTSNMGRVAHRYLFPSSPPGCCCLFCSPLSPEDRDRHDEPLEFLYPSSSRQFFRAEAAASLLRLSFLTCSRNRSCCWRSLPLAGDTEVACSKRLSALFWGGLQQRVEGWGGRHKAALAQTM